MPEPKRMRWTMIVALMMTVPVAGAAPLCGTAMALSCCKVCKKGKACGDSCIAETSRCSKPPGCACNG